MRKIKSLPFIFSLFFLGIFFLPTFVLANANWNPVGEPLVPCGSADYNGNPQPPCDFSQLVHLGGHILSALIYFSVPLAAIAFAVAGFKYMSGNESQMKQARSIFKDVVIGFVIVLAAWLIVSTVTNALFSKDFKKSINKGGANLLN